MADDGGVVKTYDVDELEKKAKVLAQTRMASSCAPYGYNLRDVTNYNKFSCTYYGTGTIDGKQYRNYEQTWKGTLPSCCTSMKIEDDLLDDVRTVAWDAAGGKEANLDPKQFLCRIHGVPMS